MNILRTILGATTAALLALPAVAEPVLVPFWTPVPVRFTQTVNSRSAVQGQMAAAEIAEDVFVDGRTVLRKGMPVWTAISYVKKRHAFGVPGAVSIRVLFAPLSDKQSLRLRGSVDSKGSEGGAGLVAASVLAGLVGAIAVTGRSGEIPAGTMLLAHIDEERTIDLPVSSRTAAVRSSTQVATLP